MCDPAIVCVCVCVCVCPSVYVYFLLLQISKATDFRGVSKIAKSDYQLRHVSPAVG